MAIKLGFELGDDAKWSVDATFNVEKKHSTILKCTPQDHRTPQGNL